jgi:hypothetical protein
MVCAIEDDALKSVNIAWVYGSGFQKVRHQQGFEAQMKTGRSSPKTRMLRWVMSMKTIAGTPIMA